MEIQIELVQELIESQFPQWSHLKIIPVKESGHDNRTFHLGDEMSVRLPSGEAYASQIEKECKWLPYLKRGLHVEVPKPLGVGKPSLRFPFPFSINEWIEGETLTHDNADDVLLARDLARFLLDLQAIDASQGPKAGMHNFYRGGSLRVYDEETQWALKRYEDVLPIARLREIWNTALLHSWEGADVWVHGDVAMGNLVIQERKLSAVIDFGILGVGDPACDFVMAWTYFQKAERAIFFEELGCDEFMIQRAKGWALWKALISMDDENMKVSTTAKYTIEQLLLDEIN